MKKVVTFDFTPPEVAPAKSSDIAFVLMKPSYAPSFQDGHEQLFQNFIKSMAADFEEMIIARGFTLRGPYDTYDEIVYGDKAATDLILMVEVDIQFSSGQDLIKRHFNALTKSYSYSADGYLGLSGKINLTASETLSQEKLWAKSIPMPPKNVYVKSEHKYTGQHIPIEDTGLYNPVSEALEEYYKKAIKTAWNHLHPVELAALKPQIKQLRDKKTY